MSSRPSLKLSMAPSTPPLTPDHSPSSPVSTSFSSRRGSTMHIDLSSLGAIKEPTRPTNTLILTNLSSELFGNLVLATFRETVNSIAPVQTWIPLKSFTRVVVSFSSTAEAVEARAILDGQVLLQRPIKIFWGETLSLVGSDKHDRLEVPALEKNWLISPPGSPPVGWTQIREDPPNSQFLHDDLWNALAHLPRSRSEDGHDATGNSTSTSENGRMSEDGQELTILKSGETQGPGIVVHLDNTSSPISTEPIWSGTIDRTKVSMVRTAMPGHAH